MSLTKQYQDQEKERQEEAQQSAAHYKSVNLPGDRVFNVDAKGVRERIAEMAEEKAKPNHDDKRG